MFKIIFILLIASIFAVNIKLKITKEAIVPIYKEKCITHHHVNLYTSLLKMQDTMDGNEVFFIVGKKWGSFRNPRHIFYDKVVSKNSPIHEHRPGFISLTNSTHNLHLPNEVETIEFIYKGKSMGTYKISEIKERETKQEESNTLETVTEELLNFQTSGSNTEKIDLTFISCAYTSTQRQKFIDDVFTLIQSMQETVPFNKYMHLFNVFGIFRPDSANGISQFDKNIVLAANYMECTFKTDGNLVCSYPKPMDLSRRIAPATDLPIVVINSDRYAGYAQGAQLFATRPLDINIYKKLFLHELGHAFGGLRDEYYDTKSTIKTNSGVNCANTTTNVPWNKWVGFKNELGTVGAFQGCGYNFGNYRPQENCLMNSLFVTNLYCAVCKEYIIQKLYKYNTKIISSVCPPVPLPTEIIYLKPSQVLSINLQSKIKSIKGAAIPFRINWIRKFAGVSTNVGSNILSYNFSSASIGTHTLTISLRDTGEGMVIPPYTPEISQSIVYNIVVGTQPGYCYNKGCNSVNYCYTINSNFINFDKIDAGGLVYTPNGRYQMEIRNNGEFLMWDNTLKNFPYGNNYRSTIGSYRVQIIDCNLSVILGTSVVWSTQTYMLGVNPCSCVFSNDGNLVLNDAKGTMLWQTKGLTDGTQTTRFSMVNENSIYSPNKKITATIRNDGDFVIWNSLLNKWEYFTGSKAGTGNCKIELQSDCNLKTICGSVQKWTTNLAVARKYPCRISLGDDGKMRIIDAGNAVVWTASLTNTLEDESLIEEEN